MSKSPHLLEFGAGWSGTTPLYYTLVYNKYAHGGHYKESQYLSGLYTQNDKFTSRIKQYNAGSLFANRFDRPDLIKVDNSVVKMTEEEIAEYFSTPLSIDKYINYYKRHYRDIQGEYKATTDFSFSNFFLSEETLVEINSKLSAHFDLKCIIILRDPVRRLFSDVNSVLDVKPELDVIQYIRKKLDKKSDAFNYAAKIKSIESIFGHCHYVIMEDLFSGNAQEKQRLETFLDHTITDIYPNAYVPDRGINAPRLQYLEDQWSSDKIKLEPDFYLECREKMSAIYNQFEALHGSLPADWGQPVDYGY